MLNFNFISTLQVIKSKKETYLQNKAKGIIPPSIEELTRVQGNESGLANDATLSDTVFKGYRDDLDFNDENDVGESQASTMFFCCNLLKIIFDKITHKK